MRFLVMENLPKFETSLIKLRTGWQKAKYKFGESMRLGEKLGRTLSGWAEISTWLGKAENVPPAELLPA